MAMRIIMVVLPVGMVYTTGQKIPTRFEVLH